MGWQYVRVDRARRQMRQRGLLIGLLVPLAILVAVVATALILWRCYSGHVYTRWNKLVNRFSDRSNVQRRTDRRTRRRRYTTQLARAAAKATSIVEAQCQAKKPIKVRFGHTSDIVVTVTTIPSKIEQLKRTLASVLNLDPRPRQVFVNIPSVCKRTGEAYTVPTWLRDSPFTLLPNVCDTGPSTKYLPTLRHLKSCGRDDTAVLVIDDDTTLAKDALLRIQSLCTRYPDAALTFGGKVIQPLSASDELNVPDQSKRPGTRGSRRGALNYSFKHLGSVFARRTWRATFQRHGGSSANNGRPLFLDRSQRVAPVDIIMGHSTYVVRPRFFDLDRLGDYSAFPPEAWFVDDMVISGCLAERGVSRLVVHGWPEPRKEMKSVIGDLFDTALAQLAKKKSRGNALHNSVNRSSHNDDVVMRFFDGHW